MDLQLVFPISPNVFRSVNAGGQTISILQIIFNGKKSRPVFA